MTDELLRRLRQRPTPDNCSPVMRAAADRIEALEKAQAWQPIETAPRDGKTVLLWVPYATPSVSVGYFVYELWFNDAGRPTSPTHWMPLPAPPALEPQK